MKGVPGIKALSIGAIISNGALLALIGYIFIRVLHTRLSAEDKIGFILAAIAFTVALLYPILLLITQRKYQRYTPVSSVARVFLHITRILQLMYTLLLAFTLVASIYNLFQYNAERLRGTFALIQGGIFFLLLISLFFNLMIFLKGWKLLKLIKSNYIDELMSSFD